jgi:excisionase family DNA binding protein
METQQANGVGPLTPVAVSVEHTRTMLGGCSRSTVYRLIEAGELRAVKSGRRTLITAESIETYVAGLEQQS